MTGGILALDLASTTGWAVAAEGSGPCPSPLDIAAGATAPKHLSGTKRIGRPGCSDGAFFNAYDLWLNDMIAVHAPDVLVFEAPILTSGRTSVQTARRLMGLAVLTDLIGYRRRVAQVFEVHLQTIKKHATGNGRAKKHEMMAAAKSRGWEFATDDEADALWLLDYALSCLARQGRAA